MKTVKKYSILAATALTALCAGAVEPSDVHVYVNPGHGGHDSDDRNVVIYPFEQGDPNGYWESNSNLEKGLRIRDMLQAKGCKVTMSRTTNTTADDLGLETIGALANASGADIFFSIHSNATGTSNRVNYPIMLYRGYSGEPQIANSDKLAALLLPQLRSNEASVWTNDGQIYGDWTFYPSWGTQGLGVLRKTAIPAMLSEGSFHDYIPETYRLMNKDFCWLESWHFVQAVNEYFGLAGDADGVVAGCVTDSRILRDESYIQYDRDKLKPVTGAKVDLVDASGNVTQSYTTDALYNGFYLFRNVAPGKYTVKVTEGGHYDSQAEIEVTANKVAYANLKMNKVRDTAPEVVSYSPVWKEGDDALLCNTEISMSFNWDMDIASAEAAFKIEPAVEGTITWEDANHILKFVPNEPYAANTLYTVTLAKSAMHGGGTPMASDFSFKFMTDHRRWLNATLMWPSDGANVHYATPIVELRTDSVMDCAPIMKQIVVKDDAGTAISFNARSLKYGKAGTGYGYARMTLAKSLTPGKQYTVTYPKEISDLVGITLEKDYVCTFTAKDFSDKASLDYPGSSATPVVVDECEDATKLVYSADESKNVSSASVASSSTKLFGNSSVEMKYTFTDDAGGEAVYRFAEPVDVTTNSVAAQIIAFVNGDCTDNTLYAIVKDGDNGEALLNLTFVKFHGWNMCQSSQYSSIQTVSLLGFKIVQNGGKAGKSGSIKLDDVSKVSSTLGVEDVKIAGLKVGPNPASDYIVASADMLIEGVALFTQDGALIAANEGNYINVSEIADGVYILVVKAAGMQSVEKVIVKH